MFSNWGSNVLLLLGTECIYQVDQLTQTKQEKIKYSKE
jgi:hypothetical protein